MWNGALNMLLVFSSSFKCIFSSSDFILLSLHSILSFASKIFSIQFFGVEWTRQSDRRWKEIEKKRNISLKISNFLDQERKKMGWEREEWRIEEENDEDEYRREIGKNSDCFI